ncbi:MAG: hypothetical protein ACREJO_18085 [Phycisphaerales bacterium]
MQWRRACGDLNTQVVTVDDVRDDSRVRLILATGDHVAIEFNGPILRFSKTDPAKQGAIERLGPDALVRPFSIAAVRARARERGTKTLADLLLDQSFVAGIGNKYVLAMWCRRAYRSDIQRPRDVLVSHLSGRRLRSTPVVFAPRCNDLRSLCGTRRSCGAPSRRPSRA